MRPATRAGCRVLSWIPATSRPALTDPGMSAVADQGGPSPNACLVVVVLVVLVLAAERSGGSPVKAPVQGGSSPPSRRPIAPATPS